MVANDTARDVLRTLSELIQEVSYLRHRIPAERISAAEHTDAVVARARQVLSVATVEHCTRMAAEAQEAA